MNVDAWHGRYLAALSVAEARAAAEAGASVPWHLALGFTNSVDRIVTLDGDRLAAFADGAAFSPRGPTDRVNAPAELVQALIHFARSGRGGEIWLGNPEVGAWIAANFRGRSQVGGTGVRAANTLAPLGFSSILHVTSLGPEQASLIDGSGRVVVPTTRGLLTPAAAVQADDPLRAHFIFEFQAGINVPLATETVVAPQANRVIVSLDPANLRRPIEPNFINAVADPDFPIRWVLVSGYSQVTDAAMAEARVAETVAAIGRWRRKAAPPRIHLELGAMPDPDVLATVLGQLVPAVDSLGLNADELTVVLAQLGLAAPADVAGTIPALQQLHRRLGIPRLSLHTQHYCLTITRFDPVTEQDALLFASLVAGTFARRADFATTIDLRRTLARSAPCPTGLVAGEVMEAHVPSPAGIARLDDSWLVFAPTLAVSHPATTIGLGDSFTAGVLAML